MTVFLRDSTQPPSDSNATLPEYPKNKDVADNLWLYVSPVLLVFGCVGNTLSLIVLNGSIMRSKRCNLGLSVLAVVDIVVLCTGLLRQWITVRWNVDLRTLSVVGCKIHTYLTYYSCHLSSWTILLVAVERLISVCLPLKVHRLCSKSRMAGCGLVIALCLGGVNAPILWMVTIITEEDIDLVLNMTVIFEECDFKEEHRDYKQNAFYWLDFALLCLAPFVVILTCNTVIIARISCRRPSRGQVSGRSSPQVLSSTTVMLALVSAVFLLTTVPVALYFIGLDIWFSAESVQGAANAYLMFTATNLIYYVSNAINFVLYCVGGSQFRQAAAALFCARCLRQKPARQPSVMSASCGRHASTRERNANDICNDREAQQTREEWETSDQVGVAPAVGGTTYPEVERRAVDGAALCICGRNRLGAKSRSDASSQKLRVTDNTALRPRNVLIGSNSSGTHPAVQGDPSQVRDGSRVTNDNNNVSLISESYIYESLGSCTCYLECTRL